MSYGDNPPQFRFDVPPPFSYEEFKTQHFDKLLGIMTGQGAEYLRTLQGDANEFITRLFYLMVVSKIQHPDMTMPEMLYAINYGMVRLVLDQGQSPEAAREELAKVPWDTLPGLDDYSRESANAIAKRAFADAVAGKIQSPLH